MSNDLIDLSTQTQSQLIDVVLNESDELWSIPWHRVLSNYTPLGFSSHIPNDITISIFNFPRKCQFRANFLISKKQNENFNMGLE